MQLVKILLPTIEADDNRLGALRVRWRQSRVQVDVADRLTAAANSHVYNAAAIACAALSQRDAASFVPEAYAANQTVV